MNLKILLSHNINKLVSYHMMLYQDAFSDIRNLLFYNYIRNLIYLLKLVNDLVLLGVTQARAAALVMFPLCLQHCDALLRGR